MGCNIHRRPYDNGGDLDKERRRTIQPHNKENLKNQGREGFMPRNNNGKNKVILKIEGDVEGTFIERPNRFISLVRINEHEEYAHVHDPGRLRELLYPGNKVLLKKYVGGKRKTKWEVLAAKKGSRWVFVNSKFHREISERILRDEKLSPIGMVEELLPEVKVGNSRIDFLAIKNGKKVWVEIKGCTLEKNGVALFPDAPTERGRRHVEELLNMKNNGDNAALIFLVFVNASCFRANQETDEKFSHSLRKAMKSGVSVYPLLLNYDGKEITFEKIIQLCRDQEIKTEN